jgi:hypothetical protein
VPAGAAAYHPAVLAELSVRGVHVVWAWVVIGANAVAGSWSLGAHVWPVLRTRGLWWFTTAAEVAIFGQVILGVVMVSAQGLVAPQFHMFYGFVALITVAILYSYRQQIEAHRYLLYGVGGLFLMGLGLRAVVVGTR